MHCVIFDIIVHEISPFRLERLTCKPLGSPLHLSALACLLSARRHAARRGPLPHTDTKRSRPRGLRHRARCLPRRSQGPPCGGSRRILRRPPPVRQLRAAWHNVGGPAASRRHSSLPRARARSLPRCPPSRAQRWRSCAAAHMDWAIRKASQAHPCGVLQHASRPQARRGCLAVSRPASAALMASCKLLTRIAPRPMAVRRRPLCCRCPLATLPPGAGATSPASATPYSRLVPDLPLSSPEGSSVTRRAIYLPMLSPQSRATVAATHPPPSLPRQCKLPRQGTLCACEPA